MIEPVKIGRATLYLGDCRDVLPSLGKVDAVVTDPPYGVGFKYEGHDDTREGYADWCRLWFADCRAIVDGPIAISCGIGNLNNWEQADWVMCWNKPNAMGRAMTGWNTWEPVLIYGKIAGVRCHDSFTVPLAPMPETGDHPCPKPVGWAREILHRLTKTGQSVCDPFMGSGTTGVAAVQMGRDFIGIEREPKYFDIAVKRIEQAQRQGDLFIEGAAA